MSNTFFNDLTYFYTINPTIGANLNDLSFCYYLFSGIPIYTKSTLEKFGLTDFVYIAHKPIKYTQPYLYLNINNNRLDSKDNLILLAEFLKASPKLLEYFKTIPEETLKEKMKLFLIGFTSKDLIEPVVSSNSFLIFSNLFTSFDNLYKIYLDMGTSYKILINGLITISLKYQEIAKDLSMSKGYVKALYDKKPYIQDIYKALQKYLLSKQTEINFIELLYSLSNERYLLKY